MKIVPSLAAAQKKDKQTVDWIGKNFSIVHYDISDGLIIFYFRTPVIPTPLAEVCSMSLKPSSSNHDITSSGE